MDDFVSGEEAGFRQPMYFILHVPKCAGRTIEDHLKTYASPGAFYQLPKRRGFSRIFHSKFDAREMPEPNKLQAVSGHYLGCSLECRFRNRTMRRTVLLREPVSHAISYYNYRMMRYLSQGLGTYDFELAYRAGRRNPICHFLLNSYLEISWFRLCAMSAQEKYELLNRCLSRFWFVADYTRCNDLVGALSSELGLPEEGIRKNTSSQWQQRVTWAPLISDDLSPAMRNRIVEENVLDQVLWDTWRNAEHNIAQIRPQPLPKSVGNALLATEMLRPGYQAKRRWKRAQR